MKKSTKIALWVVGVFMALVIGLCLSADIIASRFVQKKVQETFAQIPDADAVLGSIYLNLLSGSAIVRDITFSTNSLTLKDSVTNMRAPGLALHVNTLTVTNIRVLDLWRDHSLDIRSVTIDQPQLVVYLDEENPKTILPFLPEDFALEKAENWLKKACVHHAEVNNLQVRLHSTRTPFKVTLEDLSAEGHDLLYDFNEEYFSYNDSIYTLALESGNVLLPDGEFELETHDLATSDQGPLRLGYTRLRHIVTPQQLADKKKEPTTWIDLELNELSTSALNPIRKVLAEDYTLESIETDVRRLHVYRDARYEPKEPFSTPQDFLKALPLRFMVKQASAAAHKVDVYFSSTKVNCGELHVKNVRTQLTNVTNRPGSIWYCVAKAPFGEKGHVEARYNMHLDKAASFDVQISGSDIETHDINSFLRPLVGMTCECHIDQIDTHYKGDRNKVDGVFCMQYHGLDVQVHKEDDIPYKIVKKHAGTITQLANTLIPKSNPTSVDPAPRKYNVEWKRDEWKPYPLYLFGPCIDGVVKTMLPGLYVHKQAK